MTNITPPKWADKLFNFYCRNELNESILGDLHEQFYEDAEKLGIVKAKLNYWFNVIRFINRFTLKRNYKTDHNIIVVGFSMLKSYLLTSFRYLKKQKSYSVINIGGLSLALASCLIIFYFLHNELSFDTFYKNYDSIYRVSSEYNSRTGESKKLINSPPALAPGIRNTFPELEKVSRLKYAQRVLLKHNNISFYETKGFFADSSFLDIFSFNFLAGNPTTALDEPNSIVLTENMARKYFGTVNPVGQVIQLNNELNLKVTGVIENVPLNSHIDFEFLISFQTYRVPQGVLANLSSWRWLGFVTYVKLAENTNSAQFENKLNQVYADNTNQGQIPHKAILQRLDKIYLSSGDMIDDSASNMRGGNENTIYAMAVIALLILFIAGFNFMNLTTAASANRGKEFGLRKVFGARKNKQITQILVESIFVSTISLIISYIIAFIVFPLVKDLLQWQIEIDWMLVLFSFPIVLLISLMFGIFAGLYPASYLSQLNITNALKNNPKLESYNKWGLRNSLIIVQFAISIGLIVSTIVITNQIKFMRGKSLVTDSNQIVMIKMLPDDLSRYYDTFKERLLQNSTILNVTQSARIIGNPWPVNPISLADESNNESQQVFGNIVGYDYLNTMNLELKEGRSFSKEYASDSLNSIIINESTAKILGLENPIGKRVNFFSINGPRTIIGVVKDFNFSSLHNKIAPAVMVLPFIGLENVFINVAPGNVFEKVSTIENSWKNIAPDIPLDVKFLDDHINQLYSKEEKLSFLISGFSILAVILSCLGLYGLIAFMVNNRLKEVGIRKVLGASVLSLLVLFYRKYVLLILAAAIVSIPVVQYALNLWLENFTYRVDIGFLSYFLATIIIVILALLTISHQTVKAILKNPVDVIKSE